MATSLTNWIENLEAEHVDLTEICNGCSAHKGKKNSY
jgi:hypothetical protein